MDVSETVDLLIFNQQIMKNIILGIVSVIVIGLAGWIFWVWQQEKNSAPLVVQQTLSTDEDTVYSRVVDITDKNDYLQYTNEANVLADDKLKKAIVAQFEQLKNSNNVNDDYKPLLRIAAYIGEYNSRVTNDFEVGVIRNDLFAKYGPCWGILKGTCTE